MRSAGVYKGQSKTMVAIATDGGASEVRQVPIAEISDVDREYLRRIEWCAKEMASPDIK